MGNIKELDDVIPLIDIEGKTTRKFLKKYATMFLLLKSFSKSNMTVTIAVSGITT